MKLIIFATLKLYSKAKRAFVRLFGDGLIEDALRLHKRLINSLNAACYNAMYGKPKNCIEIVQGTKSKDPKIFKVRVGIGPRKFMHHIKSADNEVILTKDWDGDFSKIESIFVIDVNNHDYKAL